MAQTSVISEVNGSVWKIVVKEGDSVAEDDTLAIVESMKMEIPVMAPVDGTVGKILVTEGQSVNEGVALMTLNH
jgi:acetyl-CoA carboxylase biotin carboxyl carrier protein